MESISALIHTFLVPVGYQVLVEPAAIHFLRREEIYDKTPCACYAASVSHLTVGLAADVKEPCVSYRQPLTARCQVAI